MRRRLAPVLLAVAAPFLLAGCMSSSSAAAFKALNADRIANHVAPLQRNDALQKKADGWAAHLLSASNGKCSGTTLVHSVLEDGKPVGAKALGENIGCAVVRFDPDNGVAIMETGFMGSPLHRANILNATFNRGGIGYATRSMPDGTFLVYEVQDFAQL